VETANFSGFVTKTIRGVVGQKRQKNKPEPEAVLIV
jgi:hypothetical protein